MLCHRDLYVSCSDLNDLIFTSLGAESLHYTDLRKHIRVVETHKILNRFINHYRSTLFTHKKADLSITAPVTQYVDDNIAQLILETRPYQNRVMLIYGTNIMEATVLSVNDVSHT